MSRATRECFSCAVRVSDGAVLPHKRHHKPLWLLVRLGGFTAEPQAVAA